MLLMLSRIKASDLSTLMSPITWSGSLTLTMENHISHMEYKIQDTTSYCHICLIFFVNKFCYLLEKLRRVSLIQFGHITHHLGCWLCTLYSTLSNYVPVCGTLLGIWIRKLLQNMLNCFFIKLLRPPTLHKLVQNQIILQPLIKLWTFQNTDLVSTGLVCPPLFGQKQKYHTFF